MATMESDFLGIKNQANGQTSVIEKYPYCVNIEDLKNKMGRGRGRPPKNSCSSSGSTCSENSTKDVKFNLVFNLKNGSYVYDRLSF
jgi:hypothetical protein